MSNAHRRDLSSDFKARDDLLISNATAVQLDIRNIVGLSSISTTEIYLLERG